MDVVEHLKDQISNYWFADTVGISSTTSESEEFAKLVQELWPSNIGKIWETEILQLSDGDEARILNLVCALVFVDVFRRMISEVLCTKPKMDDHEDSSETQDVDQLKKDSDKTDKKDKFDWNCIPGLKDIIGASADYRQKITDNKKDD